MKKRTLTLTLCLLALVALFSIGFAAWIVTAPINDVKPDGSITVDTVSDERVTLSATISEAEIVFGRESDEKIAAYPYKWVVLDSVPTENLTATVTLTITGFSYLKDITLNLTTDLNTEVAKPSIFKETNYEGKGYADAQTAKLVGALPYQNVTLTNAQLVAATDSEGDIYFTVVESTNIATVVIKINFTWGEKFAVTETVEEEEVTTYVNPGKYFNSIDIDAEGADKKALGDDAVKTLKDLEGYLTGVTYKLTISGTQAE